MTDPLSMPALDAVLDAAPVAMLLADSRGRIVRMNRPARELFRVGDDVTHLTVEQLVPDAVREAHQEHRTRYALNPIQRVMGEGTELFARRVDGTVLPVEVGLAPTEIDGQLHVICSITDLTSRRAIEAARAAAREHDLESQRLQSLAVLAGGVAHDFNNLLVAVLGNAQLVQSTELSPLASECLSDITAAAEQAAELSRQLLAFSGRGRFTAQPIDLSGLVLDARRLLQSMVRNRVDVRTHCAQNLPPILADVGQIRQVLLNLVGNACDAMPGRAGIVHITTTSLVTDAAYMNGLQPDDRVPGTYVVLEVSDNGVGIAADLLPTIFEPFTSTKGGSRGMGLAAVRGIVAGHGAALTVYSEVNRGTTVKVLFPAVSRSDDGDTTPAKAKGATRHTILFADDNEMVRKFTRRTLEGAGYQVFLAEDGQEAVDRYEAAAGSIDLVVVDLTMPRLDGAATFRRLRSIDPDVRVLLTSGFSEQDITAGLPSRGLEGFLQKPFTPDQLLDTVAHALGLRV